MEFLFQFVMCNHPQEDKQDMSGDMLLMKCFVSHPQNNTCVIHPQMTYQSMLHPHNLPLIGLYENHTSVKICIGGIMSALMQTNVVICVFLLLVVQQTSLAPQEASTFPDLGQSEKPLFVTVPNFSWIIVDVINKKKLFIVNLSFI